jgi:hypothetical protein
VNGFLIVGDVVVAPLTLVPGDGHWKGSPGPQSPIRELQKPARHSTSPWHR